MLAVITPLPRVTPAEEVQRRAVLFRLLLQELSQSRSKCSFMDRALELDEAVLVLVEPLEKALEG